MISQENTRVKIQRVEKNKPAEHAQRVSDLLSMESVFLLLSYCAVYSSFC